MPPCKRHKIDQVKCFEYLGVFIDENLTWSKQIKHVESKLSQACGAISKIRHIVYRDCLRVLYFGHAYTYLQYSVLAWGAASNTKLIKINTLQNRILRQLVLHGPLSDVELNNNELYANVQVLKFPDIYRLETAKFMHKCVNGTLPLSFNNYFIKKNNLRQLRSNTSNPFRTQFANTNSYDRWLTNNGIRVWSEIKNEIKELPFNPFKSELKKNILQSHKISCLLLQSSSQGPKIVL